MIVHEKKHRLALDNYSGFNIVSFTCCVHDKKQLFVQDPVFFVFEIFLKQSLEKCDCDAHAYLFMSDHVHIILQGKNENSNIWKCMALFKQKTGYRLSKNAPEFKWQKDFYDHVLRKEEDIRKHVKYVLHNPVRKDLVEDWKKYPYKGSTIYDLNSWD
jgi:REP element-mobilizing transposase RayT